MLNYCARRKQAMLWKPTFQLQEGDETARLREISRCTVPDIDVAVGDNAGPETSTPSNSSPLDPSSRLLRERTQTHHPKSRTQKSRRPPLREMTYISPEIPEFLRRNAATEHGLGYQTEDPNRRWKDWNSNITGPASIALTPSITTLLSLTLSFILFRTGSNIGGISILTYSIIHLIFRREGK